MTILMILFLLFQSVFNLDQVEKKIEKEHQVHHLPVDSLFTQLQSDTGDYILFDVRTAEEFATSHLKNAVRIDPEMENDVFEAGYSAMVAEKRVVFYCSVGKRSSISLERYVEFLDSTAASASNLRGGIFRWYNSGYPLTSENGKTDQIHPYNAYWGQLLRKRQ